MSGLGGRGVVGRGVSYFSAYHVAHDYTDDVRTVPMNNSNKLCVYFVNSSIIQVA